MVRRLVWGVGFAAGAVVLGVSAAAADSPTPVAVPQSVGMMPAAQVPRSADPSPVPTLLETGGAILLAAGGIVIVRSWVSPAQPV